MIDGACSFTALALCACWVFLYAFVVICSLFSELTVYKKKKTKSGAQSECQTVWIQIRTGVLSVLNWVQTVCKGYQQTTKDAASKDFGTCELAHFPLTSKNSFNGFQICSFYFGGIRLSPDLSDFISD